MKIPTWVSVVGACMIFFGGCGELGSIQSLYVPDMLEVQNKMLETMSSFPQESTYDSLLNDSTAVDPIKTESIKNMTEQMQSMFQMSEHTKTWTVRFGYIGIVVNAIYILGGVFMLSRRRFSIKLAIGAILLSIVLSITQTVVLTSGSSGILAQSAGYGSAFGIVVDAILLIVILSMDKSYFSFEEKESN